MSLFDKLFSAGPFDINGDGKTDSAEMAAFLTIVSEEERQTKRAFDPDEDDEDADNEYECDDCDEAIDDCEHED